MNKISVLGIDWQIGSVHVRGSLSRLGVSNTSNRALIDRKMYE